VIVESVCSTPVSTLRPRTNAIRLPMVAAIEAKVIPYRERADKNP